jgi:hypothetical protein
MGCIGLRYLKNLLILITTFFTLERLPQVGFPFPAQENVISSGWWSAYMVTVKKSSVNFR